MENRHWLSGSLTPQAARLSRIGDRQRAHMVSGAPRRWPILLVACSSALLACRSGDDHAPPHDAGVSAAASAIGSALPEPSATGIASAAAVPTPVAACPAFEVWLPATSSEGFWMGSGSLGNDPKHRVVLTKPFCIDATEVTVRAYKTCVDEGACEPPRTWGMWINFPTKLDHPVNKVGWRAARTFCKHAGKDLPTEAQWEWAATGDDMRPWPWGTESPTCEHADFTPGLLESPSSDDGCRGGGTSPVGTSPRGDHVWPSGNVHDLAGNVWEWTLDNYVAVSPKIGSTTEIDPLFMRNEAAPHVARGGGWNRSAKGIRSQFRAGSPVDYQVPGLGFRCVRAL